MDAGLQPDGIATRLRIAATTGVRIVTRSDPEWPAQLDDLGEHAPLCLWVRGQPAKLGRLTPSVALVGARAATSYGEHVALELSADLAGGGIPVVSGGAYGIDGAAHRAALAMGGLTVALLAGGADRAYPAGHTELIGRIAEHGLVVERGAVRLGADQVEIPSAQPADRGVGCRRRWSSRPAGEAARSTRRHMPRPCRGASVPCPVRSPARPQPVRIACFASSARSASRARRMCASSGHRRTAAPLPTQPPRPLPKRR